MTVEYAVNKEGGKRVLAKIGGVENAVVKEGIRRTVGDIGIDEEGIQGIETALREGGRAADDYEFARLSTIARIKEAGITDDAKITEILDALYRPIQDADTLYDAINQAMVDFPFLAKIFGNERTNVYVEGQEPFSISTQNGKVENLNAGEIDDPTLNVYSDMGTVDQLISGELTPLDALEQNKIRYEGVKLVGKIKVGALKFVSGILRKFM